MTINPHASGINPRLKEQLNNIHGALLPMHKALLDHERMQYEKVHGPVQSAGDMLQLVINDPWFAWLHTLSILISQIDEVVSSKQAPVPGEGEALREKARALLSSAEDGSDFQRQYHRVLQESPEVAVALGQWKIAMSQMDQKK